MENESELIQGVVTQQCKVYVDGMRIPAVVGVRCSKGGYVDETQSAQIVGLKCKGDGARKHQHDQG